jgi:hypothetical protein
MLAVTCLLTPGKPFRGIAEAEPTIMVDPINATAVNAAIFRLCITILPFLEPRRTNNCPPQWRFAAPARGGWTSQINPSDLAAVGAISGVEFAKFLRIRILIM